MNKPKILVFSTVSPLPIDRGDRIRLYQTISQLREIAHVRLVYLDREWEFTDRDLDSKLPDVEFYPIKVSKQEVIWQSLKCLVTLHPSVVYRFITKQVELALQQQLKAYQPDLFWGHQIDAYPVFKYIDRDRTKIMIDLVDSLTSFYDLAERHQKANFQQQIVSRIQFNLADFERKSIHESDRAIVCSEPNFKHLTSLYGDIPNLSILYTRVADEIFSHPSAWQFEEDRTCRILFVGHLRYPPNALAVRYIAQEILPLLRTKIPGVECVVCGKDGEQLQTELQDVPNLSIKGFVPTLLPEYLNASVLVSPVPYATGIQNKVIEPMALGLPTIVTPQTAEANEMRHGIDVITCNTPEEFADAIIRISTDRTLAAQLSQSANKLVRSRHTRQVQLESIARMVKETINSSC
jgi:glycosyltransferase involved in cell wall biosynthesis